MEARTGAEETREATIMKLLRLGLSSMIVLGCTHAPVALMLFMSRADVLCVLRRYFIKGAFSEQRRIATDLACGECVLVGSTERNYFDTLLGRNVRFDRAETRVPAP